MRKIIFVLLMVNLLVVVGCNKRAMNSTDSKVPSGNDCAENIAYLQVGVDNYKNALGNYPSDVQQLLESKDGKGPFVQVVPKCPGGNKYVIEYGTVKEVHKQ